MRPRHSPSKDGHLSTPFGFDRGGIVETITSIDRSMFFKSMTTFADHRVWQDVYHAPARIVMSFKEK